MIHISDLFQCILIFCLLYFLYRIAHQYTYWRWRKVPFIDSAPIIGHFYPLILKRVSFFEHSKNVHFAIPEAKYYGLSHFNRPALLVRDPDIIRDICQKSFDSFPEHRRFFTETTDPVLSKNLFALSGQKWKNMRNKLTPSSTAAKMRLMFELIDNCAREFVQHFKDDPNIDRKIEAKEIFGRYTCDVIATAALGLQVNSVKNPNNEFLHAGREIANFRPSRILKLMLIKAIPFSIFE